MFKPSEKIAFQPDIGVMPTSAQAQASQLFSSVQVGPITLASRTWVPAMVPWRASEDGFVNQDVIDWYARFAKGRPGAIVVEATGIRDVPSGPLLRIGDDRFIPGLRKLTEAVREASGGESALLIQLIDFLAIKRRPERTAFINRFLVITDALRAKTGFSNDDQVRTALIVMGDESLEKVLDPRDWEALSRGFRERVTDIDRPNIRELPNTLPPLFAAASGRAERAGFQGVELHYAHAYTMASFLSALNDRTDGYGGSRAGRVRLPLEVFAAVRGAVSPNFAVGCRFLTDDIIAGGSTIDDAAWFATRFAESGMDFLSLSRGGKFEDALQPRVGDAAYPYTGPSGYECMPQHLSDAAGPFGRNIQPSATIRAAVRSAGYTAPIVVAGGIHNFTMAENILANGEGDIIAAARQSMADPDWFAKIRSGQGEQVRLCGYTNYCEGLDQKHKQVTCKLWDRIGVKELTGGLSIDGKRRLTPP